MQQKLQCPIYFADPGKPGQRGTCENTIGLIRQYIPKGTSGRHLSIKQIQRIADKLNHRPRKCLGYRTPHEVFFNLTPVALRT
jgi:IS30 family transposase